jgi:hypothetical protein
VVFIVLTADPSWSPFVYEVLSESSFGRTLIFVAPLGFVSVVVIGRLLLHRLYGGSDRELIAAAAILTKWHLGVIKYLMNNRTLWIAAAIASSLLCATQVGYEFTSGNQARDALRAAGAERGWTDEDLREAMARTGVSTNWAIIVASSLASVAALINALRICGTKQRDT